MRITCTNCDAQYEVDDGAIPAVGRDVQCSNCGHSWFQVHPATAAEAEAEQALFGTPSTAEAAPQPSVPPPPPETMTPAPSVPEAASEEAAEADAPSPDARPRRAIDDSVLAVLREEAEREVKAREAEAARGIEMQPELGIDAAARAAAPPPKIDLRTDAEEPEEPGAGVDRPAQRRDLLPDIDVINSTLRAGSEARDNGGMDVLPEAQPRKGGFRTGFTFMLVVGVVLLSVYVMAPRIVAAIPATEPTLSAYVRAIDAGRLWLDGAMQQATQAIRGPSG